ANIASADEVAGAIECGADGIGLFRTEMLFLDRSDPPSEDEQCVAYTKAAQTAKGRPVIVRLIDIGGDKPAPYLNLPEEQNPFLPYRGMRRYERFADLIHTQLRAILRASASGNLRILVPMVSCLEEVRAVKRMIARANESLAAEGRAPATTPQFGIMV